MNGPVAVAVAGRVATVTLHGAKSVNIMGRALVGELVRTLEALRRDADLGLVIVSGPPGGSFQGGVDIAEMARFDADAAREFITLLHQAVSCKRSQRVASSIASWRHGWTTSCAPSRPRSAVRSA